VSRGKGASYSAARIASRVKTLGREIAKANRGRRLDLVVVMDRSFMFAADLAREIGGDVAMHFVREDVRDVELGGQRRREVFFASREATNAGAEHAGFKGCDVVLVDAVLDSGVTQDFLLRRIGESKPRSLRLAVLLDKESQRRVNLEPDYFGFRTASNLMWCGYGLAGPNGLGRNGRSLVSAGAPRKSAGRAKKRNR
jgi:hypoxanthine phosphoribosyltransferase